MVVEVVVVVVVMGVLVRPVGARLLQTHRSAYEHGVGVAVALPVCLPSACMRTGSGGAPEHRYGHDGEDMVFAADMDRHRWEMIYREVAHE